MYCALEEVLKSNEYPPPSLREVGKKLGYCLQALRKHFPNVCATISERYAEYRNVCSVQRKEQVRQQIRQLLLRLHAQGRCVHSRYS
jgi:hypothetical protein